MTRNFQLLAAGALVLAAVCMLTWASPASAQQGKTLFTQKGCPTCHGPNGDKPLAPGYPHLKGQDATYIENQIKAFKSQDSKTWRRGGNTALMIPMAMTLSDAEAVEIAKWLASLH